jgi:hypothetical protein
MHACSGMTGTVVSCLARMIPRRTFLAIDAIDSVRRLCQAKIGSQTL